MATSQDGEDSSAGNSERSKERMTEKEMGRHQRMDLQVSPFLLA